jgi:hypothetical protein
MNVREVEFWKITGQKTDKMDSGRSPVAHHSVELGYTYLPAYYD